VCKVDEEDKAKEDEYCGADERNVISPEHKETVRNEEREAKEDKPEEDFGTPPTVLNGRAFITCISDIYQYRTEDEMEERKGEADAMDGEHSVAFLAFACHLDIIETPLLDKADSGVGLHDPGQNGIKSQYDGESNAGSN
jgi:hypothetical protein